ncbi:hypothetical protein NDU88_001524 [Pleurodeles waltl]|uniref:Uncharacterized protein n=1 Tax=Pleurodeles waltl TaxID=8319 RepID=A0AAV7SZP2_PLEWA|nr:hypothetical protein NDU88_001524 [Pleurodeles waltl]
MRITTICGYHGYRMRTIVAVQRSMGSSPVWVALISQDAQRLLPEHHGSQALKGYFAPKARGEAITRIVVSEKENKRATMLLSPCSILVIWEPMLCNATIFKYVGKNSVTLICGIPHTDYAPWMSSVTNSQHVNGPESHFDPMVVMPQKCAMRCVVINIHEVRVHLSIGRSRGNGRAPIKGQMLYRLLRASDYRVQTRVVGLRNSPEHVLQIP